MVRMCVLPIKRNNGQKLITFFKERTFDVSSCQAASVLTVNRFQKEKRENMTQCELLHFLQLLDVLIVFYEMWFVKPVVTTLCFRTGFCSFVGKLFSF